MGRSKRADQRSSIVLQANGILALEKAGRRALSV